MEGIGAPKRTGGLDDPALDPTRSGRLANVSGALLLGGLSRRMGRDKAHVELAGTAFATRLARLLDRFFEDVVLVGGRAPESAPGRRVEDVEGAPSSLRGLVSALHHARAERVVVLATDVPLMTPDVLLALTAWPEHDAVVPRIAGRRQPLSAIYRREAVLAPARAGLAAGELKIIAALDQLEIAWPDEEDLASVDPEGLAFTNVNTPEDLARAEARVAALAPSRRRELSFTD